MLRSKGRGLFRAEWYSICSAHMKYNPECPRCNVGSWTNVYVQKIDSFVYKKYKPLWLWWHNRPNSKTSKFLEKTFPNLRMKKR